MPTRSDQTYNYVQRPAFVCQRREFIHEDYEMGMFMDAPELILSGGMRRSTMFHCPIVGLLARE